MRSGRLGASGSVTRGGGVLLNGLGSPVPPVSDVSGVRADQKAQLRTKFSGERLIGRQQAGFNFHLLSRSVDEVLHLLDGIELVLDVSNDNRIPA